MRPIQPIKKIRLPADVVLNRFNGNVSLASKLTGIYRTAFYPAIERGYFGDVHSRRILEFSLDLESFVEEWE